MEAEAVKAGLSLIVYGPLGVLAFLSLSFNVIQYRENKRLNALLLEKLEEWSEKGHDLADNLRRLFGRGP